MQTVVVSTVLDAPAEVVWPAATTPQAFVHVAAGMLRYPVAERLDRPWQVGDELRGWTFLFGVVPFSRHHLRVEEIDHDRRIIVSDERGGLVRTWRHRISLTPIDAAHCRFEDRIDIDAGPLTPLVAGFAAVFYRHRQRRWRRLARLLAGAASVSAVTVPVSAATAGTGEAPGVPVST